MKVKKSMSWGAAIAAVSALVAVPMASATDGREAGGWSEESGYYTVQGDMVSEAARFRAASSAPKHTGKSERKTIRGTTNKRAEGWTNWAGKYHYTRAQMKSSGFFSKKVLTDSGRKWGTNGTSATSPWSAFHPDKSGTPGSAKTFYGS